MLTESPTPGADRRPRNVTLAVSFLTLALGIGVAILTFAWGFPSIALATFVVVGGLILGIARRHNWARWALAAVTIVSLIFTWGVVRFQLTYRVALPVATTAQLVLEAAAFYLLFRPSAGRWFRRRPA